MATFINITEKPPQYDFLDAKCIGRRCFHPAVFEGGRAMCSNRKHHGCPDPLPEYDADNAKCYKAMGWRVKR